MVGSEESPARDAALFEVAGRRITAAEVVRVSAVRGWIDEPRKTVLDGLAAQEAGERRGEALDPADVEQACDDWRYDRGLLTGEETEAWFQARGLSLDDLDAFCRRRLWRERSAPGALGTGPETPAGSLRGTLEVHLLLSGEMDRLAHEYAWRLAVAESRRGEAPPSASEVEVERRSILTRHGLGEAELPAWLARVGTSRDEFDRLLALEVAFRAHAAALLTPEARERARRSLEIQLIRVTLETVTVETTDAAREAALCILEDGRSMSELAAENGLAYESRSLVLEDLDEDAQGAVLSAAPGDLLDPIEEEAGIRVRRVVAKEEPLASDPEAMSRVDREILDVHYADLASRHVRRLLLEPDVA